MKRLLQAFTLIMGFSGQVGEIVLLREFLVFVQGQEFYVGILLANWLCAEALGSMIFPKIFRGKENLRNFILVHILFCLSLTLSIFAIRSLKACIGISISEPLSFRDSFFASLGLVFFVSLLHGMLFPYLCRLFSTEFKEEMGISGKVYAIETLGTMFAGIILTFFLLLYLNPLTIVLLTSLLNCSTCLLLIKFSKQKFSYSFRMLVYLFSVLFLGLSIFSDTIHLKLLKIQWKNLNLVHYENSKYGNLAVAKVEDQYIIFQNGLPVSYLPYPEMTEIEEMVHIPALCHKEPKSILFIAFGPGGGIFEILRHKSVSLIDYVELDPSFPRLFRGIETEITKIEFSDPRVRTNYVDGRLFLKETKQRYDIIVSGINSPSTLSSNRLFTKEFFQAVREKLNDDGIFVTGVSFSFRYSVKENLDLLSSIYQPLLSVFEHIRVLPKEKTITFLCSGSSSIVELDKDTIVGRLKERGLSPNYTVPRYIEERLHEGWKKWFEVLMQDSKGHENSDTRPTAVFYSILLSQSILSPTFATILRNLGAVSFFELVFYVTLLAFSMISFSFLWRNKSFHLINYPIITTGFYGMATELIVLFSFQSLLGYVYHWIGILTSVYMLGCALGAHLGSIKSRDLTAARNSFLCAEVLLVISCLVFPILLFGSKSLNSPLYVKAIFIVISLISGVLTGYEFPLAVRLYVASGMQIHSATGVLYGADLIGGFFAGFLTGFHLLPTFGVEVTFLFIMTLKFASLAVYVFQFLLRK